MNSHRSRVPYRNTRIFFYCYTNYRFLKFTQNTRFRGGNEAILSASQIGIEVIRRSLGYKNNSKRNEMKTGTRDQKLMEILSFPTCSGLVERISFCYLRCADRQNRLLPMNLEKIVKMRFLNQFSKT